MADKRNKSYMTVEPMPSKPQPRTFSDKNLDPGWGMGGANNYKTDNAKPGAAIGPIQRTSSIKRSNAMRKA